VKNFIIFLLFLISILLRVNNVEAKLLPRFQNISGTVAKKTYVISGLIVSARLRADRRALNVYFSNINKVTSLIYTLMYQTNGIDEGVSGTMDSSKGNSATRELEFATASNGVYRYHTNLTNMKLEVTSTLPTGKQTIKRFRIRV
jgi:hypothetical protein